MKRFFVITLFSQFFVKKSSYGFTSPHILCLDVCIDAISCVVEGKGVWI